MHQAHRETAELPFHLNGFRPLSPFPVLFIKMFWENVHGIMKNLSGQLPIRVSLKKRLELRILPLQGRYTTGQFRSCPQTLKCFVYRKTGFEMGRIEMSLPPLPTETILAIKLGDRKLCLNQSPQTEDLLTHKRPVSKLSQTTAICILKARSGFYPALQRI